MSSFEKFVKFITKYVTLWVIIAAVLAYLNPAPFKPFGGMISFLLGIIMLSMGLSMTPNDFKLVFTRPKDVIIGVVTLYVCMPLVGLAISKLLGLSPMLAVGMVLLGCTPTGTSSNVMTFLAKGDKALSVTITSLSTMLAPVIMPSLLLFYVGKYMSIDAVGLFLSIIKIVIVPIVLGIMINKVFSKQMPVISKGVPLVTVAAIVTIIMICVSLNVERLQTVAGVAALSLVLYTAVGLSIGFIISKLLRMPIAKRKALTFDVGVQNTALAVTLGITYFDPMSAIPGAIGVVWTTVFCSFIASLWGNKTPNQDQPAPELS
ncbi:bile acid:sodium symporter family protein [Megasphaera vaginalis (ex Srinivasan et al. 2021)]|uniref:Sodium Bile acid symporter family protein n=1 Tax=Megasphaera vaginalis (ex Srinivasan et al. 2021) TaxID=1111454 RepID=U7UGU2_9FIRM|nr:bile acid:sodium symporter family protein [Megasphaera vaginalis (ex Srinivasan et al. 2021)]ERT58632.1 sodium Bile acid symporter family protein [Megasphaera vaginalis (ex Srinivasan et al. 2021)]